MSDKNEHPNKKTKLDVFSDQSNHVKVKNVPVVFNDYGAQGNSIYNTLAYLRSPDWQINPIENKELHKRAHPYVKSNVSCFELLPNELIQYLFEYLPIFDLFRSFYYLNQRFRQLVQCQLTQNPHLRLNFSNLSLREFDFLCSQIDPKQVEALTLGDCDLNRVNEPCSFGQTALFLYRYHLSQFISLKSLRIIEPNDDYQLTLLLSQLSGNQLKHLWIRFRARSPKYLLFRLPFIDTIESLSLDQIALHDSSKLPEMTFKQLQYFCINNISEAFLLSLLSGMSSLRYLKCRLVSNLDCKDIPYINYNKCELLHLTTLYLESTETSWKVIESHLLSVMPMLHRLSLVGDYKTPVTLLAERWKECFLTYTPHLTDFRFYVNIPLTNQSLQIDELLKPFHEEFWQERKWYVAVEVKDEMNIHLYSLPCPRLKNPLEIITYADRKLTTIPASLVENFIDYILAEMSHTYHNSTACLDVSWIDKDAQISSAHVLYSKVCSLIIGRTKCEILLRRLIRLSSIRELTLVHNSDPVYFVNLLNMMTRLESLRLLEGSEKILFLLKENISLIQCLQKRAIRKLFLENYYSLETLTNEIVFPIDEFIQIFRNNLESLYWIKPPISSLIYSLINGLPKLKSLTTVLHSNMKFPTYVLVQWIQENTHLNTFVAKCESTENNVIWHFWF